MKKLKERLIHIMAVLVTGCLLVGLTGCAPTEKTIERNLKERYGKEFISGPLAAISGGYKSTCYPADDPTLFFQGLYYEDGSILYDTYVGAIIARDDTDFFAMQVGESIGDCYVYSLPEVSVSKNRQHSLELCDLIKEGDISIGQIYEYIKKDQNNSHNSSVFFYIFLNKDSINYTGNFSEEYEVLKNASDALANKYKEEYDLDIWVGMHIYYLQESDFEAAKNYFKSHADIYATFDQQIVEHNNYINIRFGGETDHDLKLTKEEYIEARKKLK